MRLARKKVKYRREQSSGSKLKLQLSVLVAVSFALIGYGVYGLWQKHRATNQPSTKNDQVITYSTNRPDETPVNSCDNFNTKVGIPKQILIPSVNIDGCIQRVGVDQNKAIAVPSNIHVAGWFVNSVIPGENGVSIIDGHVQGRYGDAIFGKLKDVSVGEDIKVTFGEGGERNFEVKSVDTYSVEETNKQQYVQLTGVDRQLTLITCGGRYDAQSESYDKRVVIRARMR